MAPKNKKAEKMSLGDFLGDQSLGSWADEMEDAPMPRAGGGFGGASYGGGSDRPSYGGGSGFGARTDSFADRGFATREQLPLPSKPPYTAHLGNLSFDATEGDVTDFFAGCDVTNVRIVEDKLDRKPKGFGYVEFGTLDGLKKALDLSGSQFQGRNVRVSVAEPPKDRPEARDISDWSRKGPLPDLPNSRPGPGRGYSSRGFDAGASDAGSDRGGERRRPAFESDGKQRDFGNWERKGPLSPSAEAPREGGRRFDGPREPREGGFRERQSPAWGEGERAPRREFQPAEGRPQYERQPTAADQDSQWRSKMRTDVASPTGTPDASTPSSPAPLASRPKLNLAKRTVSEAPAANTSTPSDKPNPFGAARPIDTAAREREVEEKQQQAAQAKKEADEKAREEKKAKEAAAKEAASKPAEEPKDDDVPEAVENPEAETEAQDETANGDITDDKAVKPQEPVVAPKDGGSWRRKSSTPAAAPAATTETLDEDGWSTVTKAPKSTRNNRRGGAPARAIAS